MNRPLEPLERIAVAMLALGLAAGCGRTGLAGEATLAADPDVDAGSVPPSAPANRILLFGGRSDGETTYADTWVWDGSAWSKKAPDAHPTAHFSSSAVMQNGEVVLFGGVAPVTTAAPDQNETWVWNHESWAQASPVASPSARDGAMAATLGATAALFGGYREGQVLGDTWTWNGVAWSQWRSSGAAPGSRWAGAAATLGANVVLFGGRDGSSNLNVADTWTFDGTRWAQQSVKGPSPRLGHAMATLGNTVVLFGGFENTDNGSAPIGDTWTWNGVSWTQRMVDGPSARSSHSMASLGDKVVLFGGVDGHGEYLDDTWIWTGVLWTRFPGATPEARADAAMASFRE